MFTHRLKANSGIDVIRDIGRTPYIIDDSFVGDEVVSADPLGAARGLFLAVPMSACLWTIAAGVYALANPWH